MTVIRTEIVLIFTFYIVRDSFCVHVPWSSIKCAKDEEPVITEGIQQDVSRFPWLGVVQHSFRIGTKIKYAVTSAALIHSGWAVAAAYDMAKIPPDQMENNTKFIVWRTSKDKYALEVSDYVLHPEYTEMTTMATIALVQLVNWAQLLLMAPVPPVCVPTTGAGTFNELYAVKMTDENAELEKEVIEMQFVDGRDCKEFYFRSKLTYEKMAPVYEICAVSKKQTKACVWDGGVALVTRQNWGYWALIGFSTRGAGCGAPARFINVYQYLNWMDEVISAKAVEGVDLDEDLPEDTHRFYLRHLTPYRLIMYKADVKLPKTYGQCERSERGGVLFKDSSELTMNKNFGQGFYYLEVWQIAQFYCATINLITTARTIAAVWLDHHCHQELTGAAPGIRQPDHRNLVDTLILIFLGVRFFMRFIDEVWMECFYYFKSTAYMEFRFYFSFKATMEISIYGTEDLPRLIPNPFMSTETTDAWWPTDKIMKFQKWIPYYLNLWFQRHNN